MADEIIIDLSEADDDDDYEYDPALDPEYAQAIEAEAPKAKPKTQLSDQAKAYLRQQRLLSLNQLYDLPPITWFIEDLIPTGPRTMVQGQGGSYKSFLVLDWMLCAVTGRSWHGRYIEPGGVLYMAGEGARGLSKRIDAWCEHNHTTKAELADKNLTFIGNPIQFAKLDGPGKEAWRQLVAGLGVKYLVVDTLHTSAEGVEENSNTEMGALLGAATTVAGGPDGVRLIFVHHKGKADKLGGRGASNLRDDFDVTLDLVKTGDYVCELRPDKIRDAEAFKPLIIEFERHAHTDSSRSSLYIGSVEQVADAPAGAHKAEKHTRIDDAIEAITDHGLLKEGWGEGRITDALKGLDLGYNFSHNTVGKAIKRLRETEQALADMRRNADHD